MRLDRPVGSLLLLWPTLAALWMASDGLPTTKLILIFTLGTFVMRSAGCVINDYADRHVDVSVERTKNRPLATGAIKPSAALALFACLSLAAGILVLLLNTQTQLLSLGGFEIISVEKKIIPIVKARGTALEKTLVRLLSNGEKILGKEYELEVVARKAGKGE